jgi:ABC-type transport system involved in cytochrome c biogenesis ATPase subunit
MRLRYLSIPDLPPLKDIDIHFGHEPILDRECTIHFVVGVNGTGKSRLLRALAEIFLHLERVEAPPFPVSIAYDIGRNDASYEERRTIYYHCPAEGRTRAYLLEMLPIPLHEPFDWEELPNIANWREIARDNGKHPLTRNVFLGSDSAITKHLPKIMLVYTSGTSYEWERTFAPVRRDLEESLSLNYPEISVESERPLNWNSRKEANIEVGKDGPETSFTQLEERLPESPSENTLPNETPGIGYFIQQATLKLVVCAVALSQAFAEFNKFNEYAERQSFLKDIEDAIRNKRRMGGLRDLLNEVDWLWPVNISLRINFQPKNMNRNDSELLSRLYRIATVVHREVHREPWPNKNRNLFFDLERILHLNAFPEYDTRRTLFALTEILSGDREISPEEKREKTAQPFAIFQQLLQLQQQGILEDISIGLKKRNVKGILLFDWLSDGERVYLGRMALLHLLEKQDDSLIILDEPETHFNDAWKRVVTDIIDQSLKDCSSEVVLATHSSIALTDVFDSEMTVLHKDVRSGIITASGPSIRTFGASPNEILRDIFQAPESTGQRASEFLSIMLVAVSHERQTLNIWSMDGNDEEIYQHKDFRRLSYLISAEMNRDGGANLPRDSAQERKLYKQILHTLRAVRAYTQQQVGHTDITILDVLNTLHDLIGPGYYQLEFRRRLLNLQERRSTDAS